MASFQRIPWVEDEIILALDLYVRAGALDKAHPEVVDLSNFLRSLPIHPKDVRVHPRFRNPNGVHLKFANFKALDPSYSGAGMSAFSALDEAIFERYFDRPEKLQTIAEAIRNQSEGTPLEAFPDEDEFTAPEGRLLLRRHFARERNRSLRNRKLRSAVSQQGSLPCEVCGMTFEDVYGKIGEGFIEVHHRFPLHRSGAVTTRLADLALVCPNCHRMLHRDPSITVDELAERVRDRLRPASD